MNNHLITTEDKQLIALSGKERTELAEVMIQQVLDGNTNPLAALQQLRILKDISEKVEKDDRFQAALNEELAKHGKKAELNGHTISFSEAGVTYDYSVCNDPHLAHLEAEFKKAKAKLDERQKMLQNLPSEGVEGLVDDELVRMYPPARSSKTIVKFNIKK